jgi:hypothetical protein
VTSIVRRIAGGLTILESVWLLYGYFDVSKTSCPASGCPFPQFIPYFSEALFALPVVLLIVGALGVWGVGFAYLAGAVLSAFALLFMAYVVFLLESTNAEVGAALAAIAIVANVVGMRGRSGLSEQANPMNLPVFG